MRTEEKSRFICRYLHPKCSNAVCRDWVQGVPAFGRLFQEENLKFEDFYSKKPFENRNISFVFFGNEKTVPFVRKKLKIIEFPHILIWGKDGL